MGPIRLDYDAASLGNFLPDVSKQLRLSTCRKQITFERGVIFEINGYAS
jgi:hypothetical protein